MKSIALIILMMVGCKQKVEHSEVPEIHWINTVNGKSLWYVIIQKDDGFYWQAQMPFYESNDPKEIPHIEWTRYVRKFKTYEEARKDFENRGTPDGHTGGDFKEEGYSWELVRP